MTDFDLDCAAAADELVNRGRNHERTMAVVKSALSAEARILSALVDRHNAGEVATGAEYELAPVNEDDGEAPSTGASAPVATLPKEEADPARAFRDIFGSIEGLADG